MMRPAPEPHPVLLREPEGPTALGEAPPPPKSPEMGHSVWARPFDPKYLHHKSDNATLAAALSDPSRRQYFVVVRKGGNRVHQALMRLATQIYPPGGQESRKSRCNRVSAPGRVFGPR